MEMKLNVYQNKQIVKTYTAETYDLMFGTVEDVIQLVDLDKIENGSDIELIKVVGNIVMNGLDIIKPLLKDIFDGLTDEELRNVKISEIVAVIIEVVKFAMEQIGRGIGGKN